MIGEKLTNYYHFKDGLNVALIFVTTFGGTNEGAARKAMLKAYGRTEKDIKTMWTSPKASNYVTFDGSNCR